MRESGNGQDGEGEGIHRLRLTLSMRGERQEEGSHSNRVQYCSDLKGLKRWSPGSFLIVIDRRRHFPPVLGMALSHDLYLPSVGLPTHVTFNLNWKV